ncbi:MAG TPA: DUF3465 domain-containing protein [Candidatus Dormibacteraeota bacterium]|jgi:hypothetical protein|nr:DUF3465 domain-containing protein [Candidatus Dormibacteraeota bacterium]
MVTPGPNWKPLFLAVVMLAACGGTEADNAAFDRALGVARPAEVTVQGKVTALLPDGNGTDGPHQRFRIDVDSHQVEIDHNLTLAGRVPLAVGDTVLVHGQFEPDPGRPVIHYTHHATGNHPGGWIEAGGKAYD